MKKADWRLLFFTGLVSILSLSCSEKGTEQNMIGGNASLLTDEAFYPLISAEQEVFSHFYKDASIQIETLPQEDAIEKLIKGETEMVVVSRALSQEEKKYLSSKNVIPEQLKIAYDALVFINSATAKDSLLSASSIKELLSGKRKLVIDQKGSASLNFLSDTLELKDSLFVTVAGSMEKVMDYIISDPEAVGLISLSVFKNKYAQRKDIKVLGVRDQKGELSYPFQEDLALNRYPFKMPVYLINRYKSGLGTGFASYILSEDGQRIVLKSGLLPVNMPGREVIIKKEF